MTDEGRAFVIARLSDAPDLDALRRVWESIGHDYKKCPDIQALKDNLKKNLGGR